MILEIAQIDVKAGMEAEFEAGIAKAAALFERAKGCRGFELRRSIEKPQRYRLLIQWDTLEDHTIGFVQSQDWRDYRAMVSPCFEAPPSVEHTALALTAF